MREISISQIEGLSRTQLLGKTSDTAQKTEELVKEIITAIAQNGDEALLDFTERFDQVKLTAKTLQVTEPEFQEAERQINGPPLSAIKLAITRVKSFHAKQARTSWQDTSEPGVVLGQIFTAIEKVGLYVPGGSAPLVSTVIMNAVPALIAGVSELYMVTPPTPAGKVNPALLVTAELLGIKTVYKIGGAQAIAALALGTETIPRVDKIVGPGNVYVATAKKQLFGQVDIDMIAGPSEILVLADESAKPDFVAADLLSQAEHDPQSGCYLVTDSAALVEKVKAALEVQLASLSRTDIARRALQDHGLIALVDDLRKTGAEVSNIIAPEHLVIETADPWDVLKQIRNAGAIFLGHYTPEALGDYLAGPNHVLPTSGTARFFSPLGVDDFIKKSSLLAFDEDSFRKLSGPLLEIANIEGLTAHARSVEIRLKTEKKE